MSQIDDNIDEIMTWVIDRLPLYSASNNPITNHYRESDNLIESRHPIPFNNLNYNLRDYYSDNDIRNNMFLQNFSNISNNILNGTAIFDENDFEEDEFIPFPSSLTTTQSINFIIDKIIMTPEELNCCICIECYQDHQICKLNCQHTFCITCIDQQLERNHTCPLCREHISQITIQTMEARQQIHH